VVGYMDRVFPTVKQARGRAAAGLSMGGFGALLLGLKHPDVFSAVSAHSSAILPPEKLAERPALRPIIPFLKKKENDIFALARKAARRRNRPALRLDCGLDDTLLDGSRRFHAHLEKIGYPHRYDEHPGNHNWDYWDEHVRETLDFVLAHTRRQERRIG